MRSVELFAGAGGLALGATLAGFDHDAVIEWDKWACDTVRRNQARGYPLVRGWPLVEGNVRGFDFASIGSGVDLLTAGPPCQPFSLGGKHGAHLDERDMFPATIEAIRAVQPRAFVIENVRGLTRAAFANYFRYIRLGLEFPDLTARSGDEWKAHMARLEHHKAKTCWGDLRYNIVHKVLNAADYGVPQRRERVFIVGFRADLDAKWSFPEATHSLDALLEDQWVSDAYWKRTRVAKRSRPTLASQSPGLRGRVEKIRRAADVKNGARKAWRTVREVLIDLPNPERGHKGFYHDHRFQPGARIYPGHTGSPLDLPAKTLKAGDHGVPGGENMLVKADGAVRYFTVREAARLQTFPDGYLFHGSWTETMRQLGNAVPVVLARLVVASVAEKLVEIDTRRTIKALGGDRHNKPRSRRDAPHPGRSWPPNCKQRDETAEQISAEVPDYLRNNSPHPRG